MCICPFYPADIADVHASLIASPWPDGPGLISGDVAPTSWIADDGTPADAYQTCDQEKGIDEQSRERGSPAGERRLHRHRARLHSRHVLGDWGLSGLSGDAELLVSELTTNAIAAVQPTTLPVRMWLLADTRRVLVLVWDPSSRPPVLADSGQDAENGRGLQIVQAVSQLWDWYRPQNTTGKIVWALASSPQI
jgi:anti-sigma regulatory factor (Ser/Thr protein kinase)